MSDRESVDERLTPRGAELLNSLLDELRQEIVNSAARRSVGVEISARDVIEAFEERTGDRRRYDSVLLTRYRSISRLLMLYAALGLLATLAVLTINTFGRPTELTSVLLATGATLTGGSITFLLVMRERAMKTSARIRDDERLQDGFAAFMDRWLRVESLVRLLVARDLGSSVAERPFGAVLEASLKAGRLDAGTYAALRALLSVRNEAVHGGHTDHEALRKAIQAADRLVRDLEKDLADVG